MIIANTRGGQSLSCDLAADRSELDSLLASDQITALSITHNGVRHSLPRPKRFGCPVVFGAELMTASSGEVVGETVFAHVGEARVTLSVSYNGKVVRSDLVRLGRIRYNPRS